ncbi:hypothetical protein A2U01_0069439, partial [Trifolium medium]|nr:hypothetical protein [Trifolium medium]
TSFQSLRTTHHTMNTSEFDGNAAFAGGMPSQTTQGADDSTSKVLIFPFSS